MGPDDRDDALLDSLLERWEQQRADGGKPDIAGLCRDHPGLEDELRRRIEQLRAFHQFEEDPLRPAPVPGQPTPGGPSEPAVIDRYEILQKLGEGGMGIVYKARHVDMGRIVALKVLQGVDFGTEQRRRHFRQEIRALGRLSHPNIVAAFDAETGSGDPFLVMEFVEGEDLQALVRRRGPLPVTEAVDYVVQAARGLGHAHAQSVVHRDVKPSNLLRARDGAVKVLDLGLARLRASSGPADPTVSAHATRPGAVMGTLAYMAPEQAADTASADHRADIYSLGCTLFFLLTGHAPYRSQDTLSLLLDHREGPIPSLRESRGDVPRGLDCLCQKMLAKRPVDRPQSMAEVIKSLGVLDLEDSGAPTHPSSTIESPAKPPPVSNGEPVMVAGPEPRPWWLGTGVWILPIALLVLLGGLGLWLRPWRQAAPPIVGKVATANPGVKSAGEEKDGGTVSGLTGSAPSDRWKPGAEGALFPGLIPRPAKLPSINKWQVETTSPRPRLTDAVVSADHRWFACSVFGQPKIFIYDATDLRLSRVLHSVGYLWSSCLAWSPLDKRLAIGNPAGEVNLIDVDASKAVVLKGHQSVVSVLAWSPDGKRLASGGADKTIRLWDLDLKSAVSTELAGHRERLLTLAWSPDGKRLASADAAGAVRLWRANGKPVAELTGPSAAQFTKSWMGGRSLIMPLAWRPDGQRLALRGLDNAVRIVDRDGQPGPILTGHEGDVLTVAWSPDGQRLATAGHDRTVRLWSADGAAGPVLTGHQQEVNALAWSGDGSWIASYGEEEAVRLWRSDGTPGPVLPDCHALDRGAPALDWDGERRRLLIADDFHIRSWDAQREAISQHIDAACVEIKALAWKPDGQTLVVAAHGHNASILTVWKGDASLTSVFSDGHWGFLTTAWRPDGKRLAAAGFDGIVRVFTDAGSPVREVKGHQGSVNQVCWSPDGKRLASAGQDGTIRLWEVDGVAGPVLKGHEGPVNGAAWRPDGQRLASAGADGTIRLWNQDGSAGLILKGHDGAVRGVAWRPDGQRLASAGADGTVRLWANDGVAVPVPPGRSPEVFALSWSPDGEWLAAGGNVGLVRILEADGVAGRVLQAHDQRVSAVAWSPPDGLRLVSSGINGVLCFWDSESGALDRIAVGLGGGKSITFSAGGRVLEGNGALIERELAYFLEDEQGRQFTLKPSEFARRFPGALP
jgi:WD40 repeat protein/serine/threonine protein kinase